MEEKKLTDEKAFTLSGITEWLSTKAKTDEDMYYVGAIAGTYLACERLQSENAEQKAEIERLTESKKRSIMKGKVEVEQFLKYIDETLEFEQFMGKTIERAGEEVKKLKEENERLLDENAELQKQVDELTEESNHFFLQMTTLEGIMDAKIQQAVKDTAREIYDFAKGFFTWDEEGFVRELKELVQDYGVEVE